MKKILGAVILLVVVGMIFFEFSRIPDRKSLPGKFDEVAFVRNENNTGTIMLYYAFTVEEPEKADILALAKTLQYNKHSGITTAFIFDKANPYPTILSLESPHFDTTKFKPIKIYTKDKVGNEKVQD